MSLAEPSLATSTYRDVLDRLRQETATAHLALEAEIDIHACIADPPAMNRLLQRFWGFHAVWEPAMAAALDDETFFEPRRKLGLLEADLRDAGLDPSVLPLCPDAAPEVGEANALGSLYVLEGSTLGGRVISRLLQEAGWVDGLRYFDPYGSLTGVRWRELQGRLQAASSPAADAVMAGSAQRTFAVLHAWLAEGEA